MYFSGITSFSKYLSYPLTKILAIFVIIIICIYISKNGITTFPTRRNKKTRTVVKSSLPLMKNTILRIIKNIATKTIYAECSDKINELRIVTKQYEYMIKFLFEET